MGEVQLLDGADRLPALDGRRQVVLRPFGRAEQGMRDASAEERGRDPLACRGELVQRQLGVGQSLLDPVGHHVRPQGRDPRLDRGAAVRERDRRGCPVREGEPPLGLGGAARHRAQPGAVDGERRVAHQLVVVEPSQPLLDGLLAAVVVEREQRGRRAGRRRCPSRPRRARRRSPPRSGRWRCTSPSPGG